MRHQRLVTVGLGLLMTVLVCSCGTSPSYTSSVSTTNVPSPPIRPGEPRPVGPVLSKLSPTAHVAAATPSAPPSRDPSPGSVAYLDFKNGFRDLKFGDPPTENMVIVEDAGESKYYRRTGDDLTIGGARLSSLDYGFYKNRGSCVATVRSVVS
jgi:hypothetical protein